MRRSAAMCCSASGTMVAPEGTDGGDGKTGTPFGGSVTGIVTGLAAVVAGGSGGAAGGRDTGNAASLSSSSPRGGGGGGAVEVEVDVDVDGGAAYSGWRRGWKNERIEGCWARDMVQGSDVTWPGGVLLVSSSLGFSRLLR